MEDNQFNLLLLNSFSNKIEKFVKNKKEVVKWYSCGPTIYDQAHLGHARTYISFDIIRRVMIYLGYNIIYAMNITDIDDKIINKVKIIQLCKEFLKDNFNENMYIQDMEKIVIDNNLNEKFINMKLDKIIFEKFIKKMEYEFWKDMDNLNVMKPTIITRVSEYIGEMKDYVDIIIKNNFGYIKNNSVYIDSKLMNENELNTNIFKEHNEDDYSENEFLNEKKNKSDFVLWKKSKDYDLEYESQYGMGRCGWHLECATMMTSIFGPDIDIHSGGIDLKSTHHNNEIVQMKAHENKNENFIKFFLHSGHLNIGGSKMSKSLKNFISIKQFLNEKGTSRQLRLMFLLHNWYDTLDYTENGTLQESKITEKRIMDFYENMNYQLKNNNKKINLENDNNFKEKIDCKINSIELELRNNINTKKVLELILKIIHKIYKYSENDFNIHIIINYYKYINNLLSVLGLDFNDIFYKDKKNVDNAKVIDTLINFRNDIRNVLINNKEVNKKQLFEILDDFRDKKSKEIGIKIEDLSQGNVKWTFL